MRFVLFSFAVFIANTYIILAQTVPAKEDENYKHTNTVHRHHTTTFESDTISIRDQKTNKRNSRKYIVAPSDSLPGSNVQGEKTRANYKNQFN
jgi:hypothetical protein